MVCHNGANEDYLGPGLENPHPFPAAPSLKCVTCHGGNPLGDDKESSHVPPPPQIGDDDNLIRNRTAYFNRLTLAGIDKFADYTVDGQTYSAIDYLQFINPGDLRVVTQARACGACHSGHAECVAKGVLATEGGVFSGATYAIGVDNHITENQGLYEDTAADLAVRAITDPNFTFSAANVGPVGSLLEFPVYSRRVEGPRQIFRNEEYDSANLVDDIEANGQVKSDSPLADLFHEQVAFTCGDCHLGSAGANNRAGDFRSSGCTACHMPYSLGGRSGSLDPNVNKFEPADPDDVDAPETAHVRAHRIVSVRKTMSNGHEMEGIDDYACAGCHQGSNRTVMQYWGIRLDQNQDLRRGVQYPANPVKYTNTAKDTRLFDPVVKNRTFNGRNANQYILFEDYDGDDRDDTPADVHHEAGMGCIDCHGSYDLHGGDVNNPSSAPIMSRMEQSVAIRCETCHGAVDSYAPTQRGTAHNGEQADLAVDAKGNTLAHVVRESDGNYYLYSRLTGNRHYVKQTLDVVVDSGKTHPFTSLPLYSAKGSYAMGRDDGSATTGIGPQQTGGTGAGFSHMDNMTCASCHSSWTNTCMGCHLEGEYNTGNNFSNITGERIVFREKNADFVYQSPVPFQLGVGADNKIRQVCPNTKTFFQWEDRNNVDSQIFAFSDRNAGGANPSAVFPSLATNAMMAHSIRGRVTSDNEGPRYCVACHLTTEGMTNFGTEYSAFRTAIATNDFGNLNFTLLQSHIGRNPGNQLNSPLWVHMVAGLGSGLFLFDENGCPVNPLDSDDERVKCEGTAPADTFDPANVVYNLDRIVEPTGASTGSSNHAMLHPGVGTNLRDGAVNPNMAGPLGSTMIMRLIDPSGGIVLNSWIDADGGLRGDATTFVP
ncbi:MAG: hypothetical protein AAF628_10115 [Planctomycetota bacterium]